MLINQVRSSLLTQSIRYYALQINPKLVKKDYKLFHFDFCESE